MLDLEKLRNFVAVARAGTFARAAQELSLSQPGLSRSIQALERQFGTRLLDRDRRGARVTAVGRQVLERATDLLSNSHAIENLLAGASSGLAGIVRFGVGPFAATSLLPPVLTKFASSGPQLTVQVVIASRNSLVQQLLADDIEFFVGAEVDLADDPSYLCVPLTETRGAFYVRPDHPLAGRLCRIDDIEAYPLASGSDLGGVLDLSRRGDPGRPATIVVDDLHVLGEVCLSSDAVLRAGYGAIPSELVELAVDEHERLPNHVLSMISVRSRTASPAAERVRAELTRVARGIKT